MLVPVALARVVAALVAVSALVVGGAAAAVAAPTAHAHGTVLAKSTVKDTGWF